MIKNQPSLAAGLRRLVAPYAGLPSPIYTLFVAEVINGVGIFVFPFLTLYLTKRLGMDAAKAGSFLLLGSLAYIPGNFVGGRLADKLGRKKVAVTFQVLAALMYIPCGFPSLGELVPWFVILSVFFDGATDPARTAMMTDLSTPETRQSAFSLGYLGHNLGFAVGPLIAGFLFEAAPSWIFWGNALAALAAVSLVALKVPETKPSQEAIDASKGSGSSEEAHEGGLLSALASRPFLLVYTLIGTFYGFVYAQHRFALPLQTEALFQSAGAKIYGSLMTLNAVFVILLTTLVVRLTKGRKPIWSVAFAGFLYAVGFGMIGLCKTPGLLYLSTALWTLGEIVNATNDGTYVANHTPMSHRGRFQSVLPIVGGLGWAVSSPIVGKIVASSGLGPVWPLLGLAAAGAGAAFMVLGLVEGRLTRKAGARPPMEKG